jgi:hypothetical protein
MGGGLRHESAIYVRRPTGASRHSPLSTYGLVSLPRRPCETSTQTTHISTAFRRRPPVDQISAILIASDLIVT